MSKIVRKIAKIFGSTAGGSQIAKFGSLAAGSPAYSTDPTVIQSLSNYLGGWFSAVVGSNSPAIEDVNALHFLHSYQNAYTMQSGVPEWDSTTTYYIGSFVSDGLGSIYTSLTDSNVGNALTSATNWVNYKAQAFAPWSSTYTYSVGDIVLSTIGTQAPYECVAGPCLNIEPSIPSAYWTAIADAGQYGPTLAILSSHGTSLSNPANLYYMRVRNTVTVSGKILITSDGTGLWSFSMSLPYTQISNFPSAYSVLGGVSVYGTTASGTVQAIASTKLVNCIGNTASPSQAITIYLSFTYSV